MSKRMQNLILEILQAQPSLRDSKSYLNSFAPRKPLRPPHPPPSSPTPTAQDPSQSSSQATSASSSSASLQAFNLASHLNPHSHHQHLEFPIPTNVAHPGRVHNPSTTTWDPQQQIPLVDSTQGASPTPQLPKAILDQLQAAAAASASASGSTTKTNTHTTTTGTSVAHQITPQENSTVAIPNTTPVSDALADSHTALVKVQGPFTDRQLDSIAEGLIYLKRLGLVSVVVVDHEEWPDISADIDATGNLVIGGEELEQQRMDQWLAAHPPPFSSSASASNSKGTGKGKGRAIEPCRSSMLGRRQERLRKRIMAETIRLADSLNRKGAMARPFPQAVVKVDAHAAGKVEAEARHFQLSQASGVDPGSETVAGSSHASPTVHYGSAGEQRLRPPLVSDDQLRSIRSALSSNQIPVLAPYALYENERDGTLETLCVRADDVMVALARDMVVAANRADQEAAELAAARQPEDSEHGTGSGPSASSSQLHDLLAGEVDMMPLRLMVINREGGIPSHARGGDPHLSINLASEYHQIKQSFVWQDSHPTALRNLDAISDCLSYMPQTSSGVLVTHRSPRSLIANLITNKAAHSPSLPHRLLANKKDVRHTPTIIRPGLPIKVIEDFSKVDQDKLTALLEASFRRKLNRDAYFERLQEKLDFVIVTGDYQGAAIVTKEYAPEDVPGTVEPIAYLDKFAVLPSLQGSGTVDFLWGALRDEVQGLGLLDALNDNGGKGGYGTGRDLVWKSRANNPVNRWYYERSNGFVRIATNAKGMDWQLFWCDAEDKLARLSGERRLSASVSHLKEAAAIASDDSMHWSRRRRRAFDNDSDYYHHHRGLDRDLEEEHEDEDGDGIIDLESRTGSGIEAYERARRLSKPRFGGHIGSSYSTSIHSSSSSTSHHPDLTLLPIVAPEEGGRLLRWANCMRTIPGAWAD
ncbi:hypothetical protein BCV70DRAFT_182309 [Testicularia cyperi]|uniref:Amino-acid acetyltransferase, mitochondrial n=1 Tax=Testicularia cyperi TaxID=1882483 RepID=A0A317XFE3_9BASI|nr:hypothetical protein BCV70DRAFT_182309 [Testicularia cyperi]